VISNSGAYPTVVAPGSTIVNYGTWSGTSGSMTFSGITFINYGTFTFASAITVSSPAIFRNFGTFAPSSNSFGCSGGNLTFYQDGIATLTGTCGFTMYFSKDTKIVLGASAFVSTANTNFAATRRGARLLDSSGNVLVSTDKAYGYKESA